MKSELISLQNSKNKKDISHNVKVLVYIGIKDNKTSDKAVKGINNIYPR